MGEIVPRSVYGNETEIEEVRCDACGMPNPIDRPQGHRYTAHTATDENTGETIAAPDAEGCLFCGSPDFNNGADLGDMKR